MNNSKTTIGPIHIRTLGMVVLGLAAVEISFRALSCHETYSVLLILAIARLFEGGIIIGILFFEKDGVSVVGLSRSTVLSGLRRGLLWSGVFGGAVFLVFVSLSIMKVDPLPFIQTPLPGNTGGLMLLFLVGGVVAPVTEELFFRGILYGFLRRWGVVSAVVVSSLLFALAHETVFTAFILIQFTGGLLFALAYEMEKNLTVPITLHVLGNLAIFILSSLNA